MSGSRKGISLDMTAMCDMAFLLLTFFILTAKMKTPEPVQVDIPSSVSTLKLPETDMMRITVSNEGGVYFSVGEQSVRKAIIDEASKLNSLDLTESQKYAFYVSETFGMPIKQLKGFLSLPETKREDYKQPGIPIDSANNELKTWIRLAKSASPRMKIAIKGDKNSDYKVYSEVVGTLQELNLNKFSLITSLEEKPKQ